MSRRTLVGLAAALVCVAVLAALLMAALGCGPSGCAARRATTPAGLPAAGVVTAQTFEKVLADNRASVARGEEMSRGQLLSALVPLELVNLYNERAKLTGDYADYGRAEDLLARLNTQFGATEGICLATAKLHYALHRLARAKQTLDACPRLAGTAEDLSLRADIAFYSGRYKDAGIIYRALVNQVGTPSAYIQLALYSAKTGAPGQAQAYLEAAEQRYHGGSAVLESWLALQRGLIELDRGRYDQARALFTLADERLPGYWLNEEHLAEVATLTGDLATAKRLYEQVVKKTSAPEYLDALGTIEAEAGNVPVAKQLFDRAELIYAERAKRFPEAIAGHALDHYLDAAPQPAKALTLAEANFKNRPHGDSAIALANAYLLNARSREAQRLLEQQIAQGWDTAEVWWVLSKAAEAAGDAARAATAAQEATRRNRYSATQY